MQHNQMRNISLKTSLKHSHFIKRIINQKVSNLLHLHLDLNKAVQLYQKPVWPAFFYLMNVRDVHLKTLQPRALRVSLLIGEETLVSSHHVC